MPETKWKEVNSKYKVFQSLIPSTCRKKWCISYKTDGCLWSKSSTSGWFYRGSSASSPGSRASPRSCRLCRVHSTPWGPKAAASTGGKQLYSAYTETHLCQKLWWYTTHLLEQENIISALGICLRSMLKRIFLEISSTNQKPGTNHWTTFLFSFSIQLLSADIIPTPEMEKGKLMFVPKHPG